MWISDEMAATTKSQTFVHGMSLGLLTTVAQLPHNYKIRYITPESPLDLSVKTDSMTPPSSPHHKRNTITLDISPTDIPTSEAPPPPSPVGTEFLQLPTIIREVTPKKPVTVKSAPKTSKIQPEKSHHKPAKHKAVRKLKFDEKKSSPVSGTIIRTLEDIDDEGVVLESGDIDPEYNVVEVTDEAKAEIAAIPNVIGGYACKLCRNEFEDAFGLARHRCSCIVLLEYRCPECGKRFNCPANLASHRRWHKPKVDAAAVAAIKGENNENEQQFPCLECGKMFKRAAYLRKHMMTHNGKQTPQAALKTESLGSCRSSDNSNSGDDTVSMASENVLLKRKAESIGSADDETDLVSYASLSKHFRMFEGAFTEEENIAAAALAHLRNGPSVIRHTTALSI